MGEKQQQKIQFFITPNKKTN